MQPKILVAYATRVGSTAGVAESIAKALSRNADVDLLCVEDVRHVDGYDAYVIGSAIRIGSWLPEALAFVEEHRDILRYKPVAFFTVCITLETDNLENRARVLAWMQPVLDMVEPRDIGLFAGRLMMDELPFLSRVAAKVVGVQQGEFRNWQKIRAWANLLPERFFGEVKVVAES